MSKSAEKKSLRQRVIEVMARSSRKRSTARDEDVSQQIRRSHEGLGQFERLLNTALLRSGFNG